MAHRIFLLYEEGEGRRAQNDMVSASGFPAARDQWSFFSVDPLKKPVPIVRKTVRNTDTALYIPELLCGGGLPASRQKTVADH